MVTAWDEKKNEATDYVNVTVLPQGEGISPSNMFSPNNDGQHDTWNIKNIQNTDGCSIIVYNRSGQRVYESHNYATEWNGEHNGEPLPAGVYYYVIECGTEKKSGSVTLMR